METRVGALREALLSRRVLIAEGAMATMLYSRRPWIGPLEEMNLSLPALVRDVHREYLAAGAEILKTNTFGANRRRLASAGMAAKAIAMNRAGVRIAREVAREQAYVAGVIGPLGARLEPLGLLSLEEARAAFREQAAALSGVDLFALETFEDLAELRLAVEAVREIAGDEAVIAAQVTVQDDGTLADGTQIEAFGRVFEGVAADLIGVNCSSGPRAVVQAVERLAGATTKPIIAVPGAGRWPDFVSPPDYFAAQGRRLAAAGARAIGGCCGTTPEHIRQLREALEGFESPERVAQVTVGEPAPPVAADPEPLAAKSQLGAKLASGDFVTIVELQTANADDARACQEAAIDVVSIPAGVRVRGRMSALAAAHWLHCEARVGTMLYVTCRGRSALELQSELLGAHGLGVHNIVCLSGDGAGTLEIDSIGLTAIAHGLNRGLDLAGNEAMVRTSLLVGVGLNPGAADLDREIHRLEAKARAGAEFAITQPVFDVEGFEEFLKRVEPIGLPIIASVWPMEDIHQAEYVVNELRLPVPEGILQRIGEEGGATVALEIAQRLRPMVAGLRIVARQGDIRKTLELAIH